MNILGTVIISNSPSLLAAAFLFLLAAVFGAVCALLDYHPRQLVPRERLIPIIEKERDIAAALGVKPRIWFAARISSTILGLGLGIWSGIPLLMVIGCITGLFGFRWIVAGRAVKRRLKMERAFLGQLRNLRDRMAISNQSLDTALQEIARNPGPSLEHVLAPLARGGSVLDNIVEVGERSRSPVIEYACGVLLWARSRSLDSLIEAIDQILLPVGEAQLAVQEEAMITLTQQRAVTMAMAAIMIGMFMSVIRVDTFRNYYQGIVGQIVLVVVLLMFSALVMVLGLIVRVQGWSRWDLHRLGQQQGRIGG